MSNLFMKEMTDELKDGNRGYLVGILASEYDYVHSIGHDTSPITPTKDLYRVIFYVKSISKEDTGIEKLNEYLKEKNVSTLYTAFDISINEYLPDLKYRICNIDEKIIELKIQYNLILRYFYKKIL